MSRFCLSNVCVSIVLLTVSGCGVGGTSGIVPVEGTLTYQGQPVAGVSLQFEPISENRASMGATDDNGHFVLIYTIQEKGAEVGKHKVTLDYPESELEETPEAVAKILEKHGPEGTPLEVEITGETTDLSIDIE